MAIGLVFVIGILTGLLLANSIIGDIPEITDADGDGVADSVDAFPDDVEEWVDTDGDGAGNNSDDDDDGDGIPDDEEDNGIL